MSLLKKKKQMQELQAKRGESYGSESKGVHSPSYSSGKDAGQSIAGDLVRRAPSHAKAEYGQMAREEHREKLGEAKSMSGPTEGKSGFASGGEVDCPDCCDGMPCGEHMVSSVMSKRKMAEGGFVHRHPAEVNGKKTMANMGKPKSIDGTPIKAGEGMEDYKKRTGHYSDGGEVANSDKPIADGMPAEFDDLHLRDGLEEHYTGANSGDEDGDSSYLDDAVAKVMLKRRKQHNPRPA